MARASLNIESRDASNKSPEARRLRNTGRVPGVVYHTDGNITFSADNLELAAVLRGGANLIDVEVDGKKHLTVLKDYQVHPVRGNVVHIDLQAVNLEQTVRTTVSLTLVGEAPGAKEGGILTMGIRELLIETKASQIPDTIEFDISNLHVGETVILKDVPRPEGVTILDDEGTSVIAITVPRGAKGARGGDLETEEAEDAAAAAAEGAVEAPEG
ncbi:MAG: ribosomal rRNA E-loop binding protein Ctc/L25/TL5 [Thermoleophilia bacterium]|jgi:large subunit ribosomal protein L25|nr:ribosomal rRNA E-loop binding protein Ctc/L25/TL5 [Thermoleophilia bacterium]